MSLLRRAVRRDAAEPAIIEALKASGWSVLRLSVRNGPDLAAARRGWTVMIEVKSGKAKLRDGQAAWSQSWNGWVMVMRSVEDVATLNSIETM